MPKVTKYPRLRSYSRKNKDGKIRVYYFYDMRPEGKRDVALGTDHGEALTKWDELHNHKPRVQGRVQEAIDRWRSEFLDGVDGLPPKYEVKDTRDSYRRQIASVEAVFGAMVWDEITLPMLREYLERRVSKKKPAPGERKTLAKTQGNREMSVFSIVWGKARLWGMTRLPWPAAGVKNWKHEESAREFTVTDDLFAAVYAEADQMLKDCMDIATATGMRLTDCRSVLLPSTDRLRLKANKTGKSADFDISLSQVLPDLVTRRRAMDASHLMLLSTSDGFPVTARALRTSWDNAREQAATNPANARIADQLRKMYLRDMRKRASDLADDSEGASKLLQHSSVALTEKHYRSTVSRLKPVR